MGENVGGGGLSSGVRDRESDGGRYRERKQKTIRQYAMASVEGEVEGNDTVAHEHMKTIESWHCISILKSSPMRARKRNLVTAETPHAKG